MRRNIAGKRHQVGGSNPSPYAIDKSHDMFTFVNSIPTKPLPSMLNCGGSFFAQRAWR